MLQQRGADVLHLVGQTTRLTKRSPVVEPAAADGSLRAQQLNHLAHRHAAGEAMRVHDEVGAYAALTEGKVLLTHDVAHHTLLPVPAAELVSELRAARVPNEHLERVVRLIVGCEQHLVHDALLSCHGGCVLPGHGGRPVRAVRHVGADHRVPGVDGPLHVDVHVTRHDVVAHTGNAVPVQQAVAGGHNLGAWGRQRCHNAVHGPVCVLAQGGAVLLEHDAAAKAPVQAVLVHHNGVLNVVAAEAHDCHRGVLPGPQLVKADQLNGARGQQRALGVTEQVQQSVHALHLVVRDVAHGLLAHGALVCVAR
mmetsp:Transcript_36196/g.80535  ORF Transcript_36196/g.80535 Transcript_36196/m.80535 type:complete len:309 (-) Transcript_36196:229-1155(-)